MVHFHRCPECYDKFSCDMSCTIVEDLSDDDGRPFGSHCVCDDCRRESAPQDLEGFVEWYKKEAQHSRPSRNWWDYYNGIKR